MSEETNCHTVDLDGGLTLQVEDCSNRYFGDYHRINLVLSCELPYRGEDLPEDWREREADARRILGETFHFERSIERMGVAGADVESVKEEMLAGFIEATGCYLSQPAFVARLIGEKLVSRATPKRRFTLIK